MLGHISRKYESGSFGPGAISNIPGDPGGKSYGIYQFSLNKGILSRFVDKTKFIQLKGYVLGSSEFDTYWKQCAKDSDFELEQEEFAVQLYFVPIRNYADKYNFPDIEPINEALFSIAIQHGRWKQLIDKTAEISCVNNVTGLLCNLYSTRTDYVKSLALPNQIKKNIVNRYIHELQDVLALRSRV